MGNRARVATGVANTHSLLIYNKMQACKAVYAGSVQTPASKNQRVNSRVA